MMKNRTISLGALLVLGYGLSCWAESPVPPPGYDFVPGMPGWVEIMHGRTYSIGKLDENGNFIPERKWANLPRRAMTSAGFPPRRGINSPKGPAYEYRSGRLIPGELDKDGNFIPEPGGMVIPLSAYQPGPQATRIYNLPGRLVKKDQEGKDDTSGKSRGAEK